MRTAKSEIDAQRAILNQLIRTSDTTTNRQDIFDKADEALDKIFASAVSDFASYPSGGTSTENDQAAKTLLDEASNALGSTSRFTAALDEDEIFAGQNIEDDQVSDIFAARPYTMAVRFDYTSHNYTRFGVWAKKTLMYASEDPGTTTTGVFAYSPLEQSSDSVADLSFSATYEGATLAVDSEGEIFRGFFQLTVDWSSGNNSVSSFVRDLRKVSDSSWFQHASLDVGHIIFTGLTASASAISGSPSATIRYRDQSLSEVPVSGAGMDGKFVGKSIDGPLGVIGSWSINGSGIDVEGAFGAELLP